MHGELHLDLVLCTVLYACTHLDEQVSWLFCVHVAATDLSPEIFDSKSLIARMALTNHAFAFSCTVLGKSSLGSPRKQQGGTGGERSAESLGQESTDTHSTKEPSFCCSCDVCKTYVW